MSFVRPYLRERETVTDLEFDEKGETDEEELLQAESEHDGIAKQEGGLLQVQNIKLMCGWPCIVIQCG